MDAVPSGYRIDCAGHATQCLMAAPTVSLAGDGPGAPGGCTHRELSSVIRSSLSFHIRRRPIQILTYLMVGILVFHSH